MLEKLLRIIYPPKCMFCRQIIQEEGQPYICMACIQKFRSERNSLLETFRNQLSVMEQIALAQEEMDTIYKEESGPYMQEVYALLPYTNEYRKAILRWKYKGIRKYALGFAWLVTEETHFLDDADIDAIIPVPLAPSRMRKRGFNQALDFAEAVSRKTGIKVINCLVRQRDTRPQAECEYEKRIKNVMGSIRCQKQEIMKLKEVKNIIIVDDIYTTGSTVRECIRALSEEFIFRDARVYVLVIGKGSF